MCDCGITKPLAVSIVKFKKKYLRNLSEIYMVSDTSKLSLLGAGSTNYEYSSPTADLLEVFDNPRPEVPFVIGLDCLEFTSLCPMTGQPDYGSIYIDYVGDKLCVESKSLKLYLVSYRNHGAFHEDCVNSIADDIVAKINPLYLRVFGDFNVRGGIAIKPLTIRRNSPMASELRDEIAELFASFDRLSARGPRG